VTCDDTYASLLRSKPEISSCCGSVGKTRCHDDSTMCRSPSDFLGSATAYVLSADGSEITVKCDRAGEIYGIAEMQLDVLGQAAEKPAWARRWSDLTCADMTTNVTAYFNQEWSQQLYLKSTMQEFFRAYGAACCGSIEKTRDPCEVILSAPARPDSMHAWSVACVADRALGHHFRWQRQCRRPPPQHRRPPPQHQLLQNPLRPTLSR